MQSKGSSYENLTLGKSTEYAQHYQPDLLQAVARSISREQIGLTEPLPFHGEDIWNAYELSWLNPKGKPVVALAEFIVPCGSENLIESKSLKLYLNSFNQSKFDDMAAVKSLLEKDLSRCAGDNVTVFVKSIDDNFQVQSASGLCIDNIDLEIDEYDLNTDWLSTIGEQIVSEKLHSHLLKSNCLITNQPDWASVFIEYRGPQIDHQGLLKYLISFRQHNEFHEQCVERIFTDIMRQCSPDKLFVYARYTRRGGLDINPYRSNYPVTIENQRLVRQ